MKALVLGGCGFIGSHLVDRLLASGHQVRVFGRSPELFRPPLLNIDYRFGNFSDTSLLAEALEGVDVVYHSISTTVPSTSNLDPVADVQGNLINTIRLLQLMVQKHIPRIVFLSSGGTVYGIPEMVPIPETHPLRPICSYGVVKVAIENYLQMFHQLHGMQYVVLRASNPYGERQGHAGVQGVIGTFMRKIKAGEPIEIWGDGNIMRDFIYVGDIAELSVQAGASINPEFRAGRGFDVPRVVLDISKARSEFDWTPQVPLMDGVARSWKWSSSQA